MLEGLLRAAKTHMVWNVEIVIGQADAVPAHLVYQVFPHNDDLLAAVLDPDEKNIAGQFKFLRTEKLPNVMSLVPHAHALTNQPSVYLNSTEHNLH